MALALVWVLAFVFAAAKVKHALPIKLKGIPAMNDVHGERPIKVIPRSNPTIPMPIQTSRSLSQK